MALRRLAVVAIRPLRPATITAPLVLKPIQPLSSSSSPVKHKKFVRFAPKPVVVPLPPPPPPPPSPLKEAVITMKSKTKETLTNVTLFAMYVVTTWIRAVIWIAGVVVIVVFGCLALDGAERLLISLKR